MTHAQQVTAEVVYQTDPRMPWYVRRYGCRWRSLAMMAELVAGQALTLMQLLELLADNRQNERILTVNLQEGPFMMCGPDEHGIINGAFRLLEAPYHGRQVGMIDAEGDITMWSPNTWEYQVIHWATAGPDGHYSVGDKTGAEILDPFDPEQADYELTKTEVRRRLLYRIWRRA